MEQTDKKPAVPGSSRRIVDADKLRSVVEGRDGQQVRVADGSISFRHSHLGKAASIMKKLREVLGESAGEGHTELLDGGGVGCELRYSKGA